jgi:hypothetical protein
MSRGEYNIRKHSGRTRLALLPHGHWKPIWMSAAAGFKKIGHHQIQLIVATGFMTAIAGALTTTTPSTKAKLLHLPSLLALERGMSGLWLVSSPSPERLNEIGLATGAVGLQIPWRRCCDASLLGNSHE